MRHLEHWFVNLIYINSKYVTWLLIITLQVFENWIFAMLVCFKVRLQSNIQESISAYVKTILPHKKLITDKYIHIIIYISHVLKVIAVLLKDDLLSWVLRNWPYHMIHMMFVYLIQVFSYAPWETATTSI